MAGVRIISRQEWGCPDGQRSPLWTPQYSRPAHLVIHHTALDHNSSDWRQEIKLIWELHAETRGWGDIGYRYLIDSEGNIYEGRAGGDNVIGGHLRGANSGTLGIALLGNFMLDPISQATVESLTSLLVLKCCEIGIDALGQSLHKAKNLVLPNVCGHRDGAKTECPGDRLYNLLPRLRAETAWRLEGEEQSV